MQNIDIKMTTTNKIYNAAIIGCGKIASDLDPGRDYIVTHAGAYTNLKNTNLVSISDINHNKLQESGKKWNISNLYLDYNEMLKKEKIDILSICTWTDSHYQIVKDAVNYKIKAILCEKPLAKNLDQAEEMIKLCKEKNILLFVNHQRRFDPFHNKIREYISNGNIGKIQQANFYYSSGIENFGSHMFDLLRFFFGEPKFVQSYYKELKEDPGIDGIVKFKDFITTIQYFDTKNYSTFDFYIYGTKGALKITRLGLDLEVYEIENSDLLPGYKELFRKPSKIFRIKDESPMIRGIEHILDCINNNTKQNSSGHDGFKSLELIEAFKMSADKSGEKIAIPLKV